MFSREQNILYSVYRIFIQGERDRQRETQRESIQQEINFFSKSFQQRLSQLHIYIKILLQLSNLQIVFFTNFNFSLLQEWEYQYKKIDEETITQN